MTDTHMVSAESPPSGSDSEKRALERKVEAGSWGLFFVWLGLGLLFDVGSAIWLLGVASIVLGTQALCSRLGLRVDGFWIVVGLCFLLGGFWELFAVTVALVPILLVLAGAALLITAFRKKK